MKKSKANSSGPAAEQGYWLRMSHAPEAGESSNVASMLPVMLFGALVILIVHAFTYTRDISDFYWMTGEAEQNDFFSYGKMIAILILAAVVLFIALYRVMTATLAVKKSWVYVPMGVYAVMTLISYAASDHKDFSLLGYIDRFEGTLVILAYLLMLFYIINAVNSERNVKMVIGAVGVSMAVLCALGLSQALGHDFFRTEIGKRLMTPRSWWGELDSLDFTFEHNEIYQTVYNINYVSFYLALIIPVFALVMIYALNNFRQSKKTAAAGVLLVILMAGLVFNLGGSKSMGGVVGLAAAFVAALILLNKRLIQWWRSVAVLLVIVVAMFAATNSYWLPEIEELFSHDDNTAVVESSASADGEAAEGSVSDVKAADAADSGDGQETNGAGTAQSAAKDTAGTVFCDIDYFVTDGNVITTSFNNDELDINVIMDETGNNLKTLVLTDGDGNELKTYGIAEADGSEYYAIDDERYHDYVSFYLTQDDDLNLYLILTTCDREWPFVISGGEVFYRNGQGNLVTLNKVPAYGFKNNQGFGSGRGYIWSRTLGMLKSDVLIGDGADTYCINFPQNDYAGKYDSPSFHDQVDITVDKPHNMYMGMFQGTGGIAAAAFVIMLLMYILQTVKVLKGIEYRSFSEYAAAGIFIGVIGFAVAGLMNDSSVSVMPLFYTMLGTGIALNFILKRKAQEVSDAAAQ